MKEEEKRMPGSGEEHRQIQNAVARYKIRRIAGKGTSRAVDDIAIPDYVMWDFGFPEEPHDISDLQHDKPGA